MRVRLCEGENGPDLGLELGGWAEDFNGVRVRVGIEAVGDASSGAVVFLFDNWFIVGL